MHDVLKAIKTAIKPNYHPSEDRNKTLAELKAENEFNLLTNISYLNPTQLIKLYRLLSRPEAQAHTEPKRSDIKEALSSVFPDLVPNTKDMYISTAFFHYTRFVFGEKATMQLPLHKIPKPEDKCPQYSKQQWRDIFKALSITFPEFLWRDQYRLEDLRLIDNHELFLAYQEKKLSWTEMLWHLSRKNADQIIGLKVKDFERLRSKIDHLEEITYEPERRAEVDDFIKESESKHSAPLAALNDNGDIMGICIAGPLNLKPDYPYYFQSPIPVTERTLYSSDLTIAPEYQSMGLGLRLKVEQLIRARQLGADRLTSRNRFPDAEPMSTLNHKLGSVVCHISTNDYGGDGSAFYQSTQIHRNLDIPKFINIRNIFKPGYTDLLDDLWERASHKTKPLEIWNYALETDELIEKLCHENDWS